MVIKEKNMHNNELLLCVPHILFIYYIRINGNKKITETKIKNNYLLFYEKMFAVVNF